MKNALWVLRIGALLVCAYISSDHMAEYWWLGPMFGMVVLIWQTDTPASMMQLPNGLFLAASTLIYALVVRIVGSLNRGDWDIYVGVAAGTILLPVAHAWFLRAPWKRAKIAIPAVYAVWFLVSRGLEGLERAGPAGAHLWEMIEHSKVVNSASIWQAAYLAFMFRPAERATVGDGSTH